MKKNIDCRHTEYADTVPYGWLQIPVHPSWKGLLEPNVLELLTKIAYQVTEKATPQPPNLLRFLETDLNFLKIVIIGQDPYPGIDAATGRAFEVGNLKSWAEPFRQVSLKNMIRLLWCVEHNIKPYLNEKEYTKVPSFSKIRKEIETGSFAIASPDTLFSLWERQGVLLLNTSFSIINGQSGIHKAIWAPFSSIIIKYIVAKRPDLIWFLWGAHAKSLAHNITQGKTYESNHPMMCSVKAENDFLRNPCFHETAFLVKWL